LVVVVVFYSERFNINGESIARVRLDNAYDGTAAAARQPAYFADENNLSSRPYDAGQVVPTRSVP